MILLPSSSVGGCVDLGLLCPGFRPLLLPPRRGCVPQDHSPRPHPKRRLDKVASSRADGSEFCPRQERLGATETVAGPGNGRQLKQRAGNTIKERAHAQSSLRSDQGFFAAIGFLQPQPRPDEAGVEMKASRRGTIASPGDACGLGGHARRPGGNGSAAHPTKGRLGMAVGGAIGVRRRLSARAVCEEPRALSAQRTGCQRLLSEGARRRSRGRPAAHTGAVAAIQRTDVRCTTMIAPLFFASPPWPPGCFA